MPTPNPSIQSYFKPISNAPDESPNAFEDGDGFNSKELRDSSSAARMDSWRPEKEYEEECIGNLCGGTRPVLIQGRIVNFFNMSSRASKKGRYAAYWKLIVKDDTGAISVGL
jgi:hypothetical protein